MICAIEEQINPLLAILDKNIASAKVVGTTIQF